MFAFIYGYIGEQLYRPGTYKGEHNKRKFLVDMPISSGRSANPFTLLNLKVYYYIYIRLSIMMCLVSVHLFVLSQVL